jgi:hypothetical protein
LIEGYADCRRYEWDYEAYVTQGENQLMANLNMDIYQGRFIRNGTLKWIYLKLVHASATILGFLVVYLASTKQIDDIDPMGYLTTTNHKNLLIVVAVLTAFCYLSNYYYQQNDEKEAEKEEKGISKAYAKMIVELSADIVRVIDYGLVLYLLDLDLFSTSTNSHLKISKYILVVMWVFFTARKVIFWCAILIVQRKNGHPDDTPWDDIKQAPDRMKDITANAKVRLEQFNYLLEQFKAVEEQVKGQAQG